MQLKLFFPLLLELFTNFDCNLNFKSQISISFPPTWIWSYYIFKNSPLYSKKKFCHQRYFNFVSTKQSKSKNPMEKIEWKVFFFLIYIGRKLRKLSYQIIFDLHFTPFFLLSPPLITRPKAPADFDTAKRNFPRMMRFLRWDKTAITNFAVAEVICFDAILILLRKNCNHSAKVNKSLKNVFVKVLTGAINRQPKQDVEKHMQN